MPEKQTPRRPRGHVELTPTQVKALRACATESEAVAEAVAAMADTFARRQAGKYGRPVSEDERSEFVAQAYEIMSSASGVKALARCEYPAGYLLKYAGAKAATAAYRKNQTITPPESTQRRRVESRGEIIPAATTLGSKTLAELAHETEPGPGDETETESPYYTMLAAVVEDGTAEKVLTKPELKRLKRVLGITPTEPDYWRRNSISVAAVVAELAVKLRPLFERSETPAR